MKLTTTNLDLADVENSYFLDDGDLRRKKRQKEYIIQGSPGYIHERV